MFLNEFQKEAVNYISGPCLILAGAGSGKTRVIISKIIHLIKIHNYSPKKIAAITFTNKAACEMKSRISSMLPLQVVDTIKISTFHALGLEIIKSELKLLKIESNFSIFDEQDKIAILREIISVKDRIFLPQVRQAISNWKNKLLDPSQAENLSNSLRERKFSNYYKLYNSYLQSSNILDFDDLIFLPTLLLKNNKSSRERWNDKINYLLVDEYQDTNSTQYELIKLLSSRKSDFTLVGDDDQSIYSWRGANVRNFLSLKKDYPNLRIIIMQQNYRSSGRILKVANMLISKNSHFLKKELFSSLNYGSIIKIMTAKNAEDEAEIVLKQIMLHKLTYNTKYKDYAILYRNNYQVKIFEKVLIRFKIPYHILANTSFFSRPEIKDLLAYLKLIINPNDNVSFLRVVNKPLRGIGIVTLNKVKELGQKRNSSLFFTSFDIDLKSILPKYNFRKLMGFVFLIKKVSYYIRLDPIKILRKLVEMINYEEWLIKNFKDSNLRKMCMDNISVLLNWIIDALKQNIKNSKKSIIDSLSDVVSEFILQNTLNEDLKDEDDYVQLMTLHASKGLEFLYVFIVGMEEGLLPHYRSIITSDIDEERRLAYVGITRAKKELFLSYAIKRFQYGIVMDTKPSRFLSELPMSDLLWNENKVKVINKTNNYFMQNIKYFLKQKKSE